MQSLKADIEIVDDAANGCCFLAIFTTTTTGRFLLTAVICCTEDRRCRQGVRYRRVIRKAEPEVWKSVREACLA